MPISDEQCQEIVTHFQEMFPQTKDICFPAIQFKKTEQGFCVRMNNAEMLELSCFSKHAQNEKKEDAFTTLFFDKQQMNDQHLFYTRAGREQFYHHLIYEFSESFNHREGRFGLTLFKMHSKGFNNNTMLSIVKEHVARCVTKIAEEPNYQKKAILYAHMVRFYNVTRNMNAFQPFIEEQLEQKQQRFCDQTPV